MATVFVSAPLSGWAGVSDSFCIVTLKALVTRREYCIVDESNKVQLFSTLEIAFLIYILFVTSDSLTLALLQYQTLFSVV